MFFSKSDRHFFVVVESDSGDLLSVESLLLLFLSFSNMLVLNDRIWRTPITDMLNLDENKFDHKEIVMKEKALRETLIRSMHEVGEMKIAQELRVDEFSVQKLRESHDTIQKPTSETQELQEKVEQIKQ